MDDNVVDAAKANGPCSREMVPVFALPPMPYKAMYTDVVVHGVYRVFG